MTTVPPEPTRTPPSSTWEHIELYKRVKESLWAVPNSFESDINITGISATDIFNLNAILSAAIEEQVVETLNNLRPVWDPNEEYLLYNFVRQAQTFPDVRLQNASDPTDVLMGIELKGWYLLAKEKEPSFRYTVSGKACAEADLLVVYPWYLTEVISGKPKLLNPYVENARYVAEYRNYHWDHIKRGYSGVKIAQGVGPYPNKSDPISDKAVKDSGGNFGRIARTGLMDAFTDQVAERKLAGIPAEHWRRFLVIFKDAYETKTVQKSLKKVRKAVKADLEVDDEHVEKLTDQLLDIAKVLIK